MLTLFITFLLMFGGIMASDVCKSINCSRREGPMEFPETNEELQKNCNVIREELNCTLTFRHCHPQKPENILRLLNILNEICSEDTDLHAAIVDNLKCFKTLVEEETERCSFRGESADRLQRFAEVLTEEGLISLTDNETDTVKLDECIRTWNYFACNAVIIERKCGNVAMNIYTEILHKMGPGGNGRCEDSYNFLPVIIRVRKLEEENDIAAILSKKK